MSNQTIVVNAAKQYLGKPWKHNQSNYSLDCFRLWQQIAEDVGIELTEDTDFYSRNEPIKSLKEYLDKHFAVVPEIEVARLVLFEFSGCGHLGVVSQKVPRGWRFIHASNTQNKVTESILDRRYQEKINSIYKLW